MELRQLRYFVRVVEMGSIGRAAREMGVVASALSQQISRLESELSTRLLQRSPTGVVPTDAGRAFWRQARLALRHIDNAAASAQQARLAGSVSVGFSPTIASLLAEPFFAAMQSRYPDVRLHLVEGLSGHTAGLLNGRVLDLAVLFRVDGGHGWQTIPLVNERLFLFAPRGTLDVPDGSALSVSQFAHLPLGVTSRAHGLRLWVDAAFERAGLVPKIAVEVDGAITLLDIACTHRIATIQPGAAIDCLHNDDMQVYPMADPLMFRRHVVTSAPDDELSPPALAARLVLVELMRSLVTEGRWPGATLHEP